jgi:hypothetical protein
MASSVTPVANVVATFLGLEPRDWLIIAATIAGPILAVQAQKWIEMLREQRSRKLWVFQQLMATRAARTSAEHVQALNMIDLVFYGAHPFGIHRRSKTEATVLDAWKEYHNHLNQPRMTETAALTVWVSNGDKLFVDLLFAIAQDVRFKFDRVQLKTSGYSPIAHGELEYEQNAVRKLALELLAGKRALKMDVASFPADEEALRAQANVNKALGDALAGKGALTVQVKRDEPAS